MTHESDFVMVEQAIGGLLDPLAPEPQFALDRIESAYKALEAEYREQDETNRRLHEYASELELALDLASEAMSDEAGGWFAGWGMSAYGWYQHWLGKARGEIL